MAGAWVYVFSLPILHFVSSECSLSESGCQEKTYFSPLPSVQASQEVALQKGQACVRIAFILLLPLGPEWHEVFF